MRYLLVLALLITTLTFTKAQTLPLGTPVLQDYFRRQQLLGNFDSLFSFNYLPLVIGKNGINVEDSLFNKETYFKEVSTFFNGKGKLKLLPVEFRTSFDSHHPDSRNDGAQIRSRGLQTYTSAGFSLEWGMLTIQLKPEFIFAQNRDFEGFLPQLLQRAITRRLVYENTIDLPERYGESSYKRVTPGQSSIRINKWGLSLGLSTENLWWGPGIRNSIMMSNNAEGFAHFTFNTQRPIKTAIGSFEGIFVTGRLDGSGFKQSAELEAATEASVDPKPDDWRYFQSLSVTYSPKWVKGLSLGLTRWAQQYWQTAKISKDYFPILGVVFRANEQDEFGIEINQDQAAGVFGRWVFYDAKAEIYFEFARNDAAVSLRDLFVDTDHSRAYTIGFHKLIDLAESNGHLQVLLEITKTSQTESRIVRLRGVGASSWYRHSRVRHGFTNRGDILGSALGGSGNALYLEVAKVEGFTKIGAAIERFTHNQDFLTLTYDPLSDFTRPWVDYNLHAFFNKKFDDFYFSGNIYYTRAVNYQWKISENPRGSITPFFPSVNRGNLNIDLKIAYLF